MENEDSSRIIRSVIAALNIKTIELGEQLDVNKSQFYDYSSGRKIPGWGFWTKLKATYPQVSAEFLLTGKGAVLLDQ